MISPALQRLRDALTVAEEARPAWCESLPMRTTSKLNDRNHWAKVGRSSKSNRQQWAAAFRNADGLRKALGSDARLVVVLTRCAPRGLDSDNLAGALKNCRDGIADALEVSDSPSGPVTWLVDQEHCKEPRVRAEVYVVGRENAETKETDRQQTTPAIKPARALKTDSGQSEKRDGWPEVAFFDDDEVPARLPRVHPDEAREALAAVGLEPAETPDGRPRLADWREKLTAQLLALPKRDWKAGAVPNFVKAKGKP